jgi:hypothetical protein
MKRSTNYLGKPLLAALFLLTTCFTFAQSSDSTDIFNHFSGAISITNKGISTVPSFTLGKPAAELDLWVGKGNLRFEPIIRISMEGKPWSLIFWWRYKFFENDKFRFRAGAHPALLFKTVTTETNGIPSEIIRTYRYLATDLAPTFFLTRNISVGPYYLYSRSLEKDVARNTHYISMVGSFSNIKLSEDVAFGITPQVYYLRLDQRDGLYATSAFSLTRKDSPFSIAAIINKKIDSQIAGEDFLWNVSLVYSFNKKYVASEMSFINKD